MAKKPVPLAEWRPDIALLDTQFAAEIENVFAGVNSYLPVPSLAAFAASSLAQAGNDTFTKVLLQFDGADGSTTITDSNIGGAAHSWAANGNAQIDTAQSVFGGASLLLDGTGDYVNTFAYADLALGSQDFTIEFWFRFADAGGTQINLAGQTDSVATPANTSFLCARLSTNVMWGAIYVGTTLYQIIGTTQFTNALNTGWHHYALVRKDTALRLFIDGVQEGGTLGISGSVNTSANALSVGRGGEIVGNTHNGHIDAFRLSVGTARWSEDFTPPRVAYFDGGGTVCGLYTARMSDGTWKIYGGTTTKLLSWSVAGWVDVSRTTGGAYNVAPGDLWMFEQSGDHLVAVNSNDDPQWIEIDSGSNFEALPGSPPRATNVKQIGDFLFLSGLPASNRKIIWSAINDISSWSPGTNLCDEQLFADNGPVQSIQGAEIGYVVQDRGIRTLQFLPGDTNFIFNFSRVLHDRGCISKYGATAVGNVLYFVSEDGFYSVVGQQVVPIGHEKINEWWLAHSDADRRNVIQAIANVSKPYVVWVYHSFSGSQMYDRQLIYNWSNQRWGRAAILAQVWGQLASQGLDLDTTGSEFQDALLDSAARGLDSFAYVGGRPAIGAIDADGFLAALSGPNMPATMESAEAHLVPGGRAFVSEVYPLDDAASDAPGTVTTGTRERLQGGAPIWTQPVDVEQTIGTAFVMTSARLHRFRRSIPAGSTWTHAQGFVVEVQQDGTVA